MKKFISSVFIALVSFVLFAEFNHGPAVNYNGKPSASGQPLFKWFSPYYQKSWQISSFAENNKELIEWEIEKMFKEKIFKTSFFPKAYVNEDFAVNYLFMNPAFARKLLPLVILFYKTGRESYNNMSAEKLLYVLMRSDDNNLKKDILQQTGESRIQVLTKKYNEIYSRSKIPPAKELKKKAYEEYLSSFKRSNRSISINEPDIEDWLENWDFENTIRDILKQKAVTDKNMFVFVGLLEHVDKIPESLATNIIRYFKLDTLSPQISETSLRMLGKNPALDKALLNNFKYIKAKDFPGAYYSAAARALNIKIPAKSNPRLLVKSMMEVSPQFILTYARLTNYDKAFALFLKEDERFSEGFYGNRSGIDSFSWQAAIYLLGEGSNLSIKNANVILEKSIAPSQRYKLKLSSKFSKLLKNKNLILKNFLGPHSEELPLGAFFPFESLNPEAQEVLFKTYSDIMTRKGYKTRREAVLEKLFLIKSSTYKHKAIKLLMESESRSGNEALQTLSLKWLPELLTVAAGKDPILAVKACELIRKNSLLGKAAGPKLRELLNTKNNFSVKIAAICALAEIGDKDSIPVIRKFFDDKNRLLARAAKQAVYLLQPLDEKDKLFEKMLKNKPRPGRW